MRRLLARVQLWRELGASWWTAARLAWHGALPVSGGIATDPSVFNNPPGTSASTQTAIPQFTAQQTTANLAAGATINFDFNTDTSPIFDVYVFADQPIQVIFFVRQSSTDTYRQLDAGVFGTSLANQLNQVVRALRLAGSQVRVQLKNNTGSATTVLSAQAHSRSI
jgi:hypothetical protein